LTTILEQEEIGRPSRDERGGEIHKRTEECRIKRDRPLKNNCVGRSDGMCGNRAVEDRGRALDSRPTLDRSVCFREGIKELTTTIGVTNNGQESRFTAIPTFVDTLCRTFCAPESIAKSLLSAEEEIARMTDLSTQILRVRCRHRTHQQ